MSDGLVPVLTVPRKRWSATVRERVLKRFDYRCAMCRQPITPASGLEYDHVLPLALGGEDVELNLQVLDKRCHTIKTGGDVRSIRKADRARHRHQGTEAPSARPLEGAGFRKAPPQRKASEVLSKTPPDRKRPLFGRGE